MIRYIYLVLGLSALLVCAIGCGTSGRNVAEEAGGEFEIRIYEVFGMDCPGCHGALNNLVLKIPAVKESEANWKEKRLVVTVRPGVQLSDEDVYEAIRRANFTPGKRLK